MNEPTRPALRVKSHRRASLNDSSQDRLRLLLLPTMIAALLGCATARLSNEVKPFVGRDIHELYARLGNPTGEQETTGDRVYVWSISSEGVMPKGTGEGTITVQRECTLEVTVNADNVIRTYQVEGSDAGCTAFHRHLSR